MLKIARINGLSAALQAMLPGAIMEQVDRTDWHSATFAGEQITMILTLPGEPAMQRVKQFAQNLPDQEFALPGWFVADIVAAHIEELADSTRIIIEALLIKD